MTGPSPPTRGDLLTSVYEGADFAIFVVDPESDGGFRCVGINRVAATAAQAPQAAFTDRRLEELEPVLGKRTVALLREQFERCLAAETTVTYEQKLATGGVERVLATRLTPLRTPAGTIYRLVGTATDISAQVLAERRLRHSSLLLEKIQPLAHLGIWQWDIKTDRVEWSDELYRIYGLDPTSFGASFAAYLERVHSHDRERVHREVETALREGKPFQFHERIVRPGGQIRHLRSWGGVVLENGQPERMFGACLDVTESVEAQRALQASHDELEKRVAARTAELAEAKERAESADRLKSAFLATMSHELRTPLNSIIGFTGVMLKELPGPVNEEQKKQLGMVRTSANHLLALINDVLDLSKIEAGQLRVEQQRFAFCASGHRVVEAQRVIAEGRGLRLTHQVAPGVGDVVSDQRRVEQILFNLLSNAIKFTPAGEVEVTCSRQGDQIQVAVRDSGMGIAPADQERVFRPFQQVNQGLGRSHDGTGLGLSISRRLARMLGGNIALESTLGHGSTFILTLPVYGHP